MRIAPPALWTLLAAAGCASSEPTTEDASTDVAPLDGPAGDEPPPVDCTGSVPSSGPRYLPLAVGASWAYHIFDLSTAEEADKTSTVEALEDVGGRKAGACAYRVRTEKINGTTVTWQQDTGEAVVRHHEMAYNLADVLRDEEWYDAYKIRLDEAPARIALGAEFNEEYEETHVDTFGTEFTDTRSIDWTVEAVDDVITVPADTFTCLRVRHTGTVPGQSDKVFWFALGIGKVREQGRQIEELTAYSLP